MLKKIKSIFRKFKRKNRYLNIKNVRELEYRYYSYLYHLYLYYIEGYDYYSVGENKDNYIKKRLFFQNLFYPLTDIYAIIHARLYPNISLKFYNKTNHYHNFLLEQILRLKIK